MDRNASEIYSGNYIARRRRHIAGARARAAAPADPNPNPASARGRRLTCKLNPDACLTPTAAARSSSPRGSARADDDGGSSEEGSELKCPRAARAYAPGRPRRADPAFGAPQTRPGGARARRGRPPRGAFFRIAEGARGGRGARAAHVYPNAGGSDGLIARAAAGGAISSCGREKEKEKEKRTRRARARALSAVWHGAEERSESAGPSLAVV